jgi:SecD/SecF fusion protein
MTGPDDKASKMDAVIRTLKARVSGFSGVTDPTVQKQGDDKVIVELPGLKDRKQALEDIQSTAQLRFIFLRDLSTDRNPSGRWHSLDTETDPKTGADIYSFEDSVTHQVIKGDTPEGQKLILEKVVGVYDAKTNPNGIKPMLTGEDVKPNASADIGQNDGRAIIHIEFKPNGAAIFRDFTRAHIGEVVAIFLGDRILTAPRINEAIPNGQAEISGFKDLEEAQRCATLINTGALPVPLQIIQLDSVEATLGKEVVHKALMAGLIGLIMVLAFMLIYYRLPGLLANLALAIYALLTFAAFKVFGVTMTLPGLAGFILSIGMAVDANVLIFERLKEELRSGKTLNAAIDAGFSRAFTAIFDSNMCTVITTVILMWYGTGMVKSFAFTLLIGVLISLFTAITVTRTFLHLLVNQGWAQNPALFGLSTSWFHRTGRQLNVVGKRNWYFALSALIIIPGVVFFFVNQANTGSGLVRGIEFKPGTSIQMTFDRPVTTTDVTETVDGAVSGITSTVQISNGKTAFIRTDLLPGPSYENSVKSIKSALTERFGQPKDVTESSVGPVVSGELTQNAIWSVILAGIAIVLYLSFRFALGGFKSGFKYGMCAIIATFHDVVVIVGIFAILGHFLGWEVDTLFVTAVLTIIGFSTHDTIVVFDRIRENLRHRLKGEDYEALANRSILQTFSRSINTSMTVVLTILALLLFGGTLIQHFYVALLVGIISGTYSSIFNATPLLVVWEKIASRRQSGSGKTTEEKPMVTPREFKPMVDASAAETDEEGSALAPARTQVKPKRKKKRY